MIRQVSPGFTEKALHYAHAHYQRVCYLNSNAHTYPNRKYGTHDELIAFGTDREITCNTNCWETLKQKISGSGKWWFGHLSYDLKNELEKLHSNNADHIGFPLMHFFNPKMVIKKSGNRVSIEGIDEQEVDDLLQGIEQVELPAPALPPLTFNKRTTKEEYLDKLAYLKAQIQQGNVYEINYCQEFFAENADLDPVTLYTELNSLSPTPFSCFYKVHDRFLLSASPERFLKKQGNKLISQPIKGTIKRGQTETEDQQLREQLRNSKKEQTENVMIVDLVRNDLSKSAAKASVKVEELFGTYRFPQVFQLISTITSELKEGIGPVDAIKYCFPMGSMTGAPKISAMGLIEEVEDFKRGIYSGAVGYFSPNMDFDFNVVIRSLAYNRHSKHLGLGVGGAITFLSDPEAEYEECLTKAKAVFDLFGDR